MKQLLANRPLQHRDTIFRAHPRDCSGRSEGGPLPKLAIGPDRLVRHARIQLHLKAAADVADQERIGPSPKQEVRKAVSKV